MFWMYCTMGACCIQHNSRVCPTSVLQNFKSLDKCSDGLVFHGAKVDLPGDNLYENCNPDFVRTILFATYVKGARFVNLNDSHGVV